MKEQHQNIKFEVLFFFILSVFCREGGSCHVLSLNNIFLIFVVFLISSCVYWSTSMFVSFIKMTVYKTPIFGEAGVCNKIFVFKNEPVYCKM